MLVNYLYSNSPLLRDGRARTLVIPAYPFIVNVEFRSQSFELKRDFDTKQFTPPAFFVLIPFHQFRYFSRYYPNNIMFSSPGWRTTPILPSPRHNR